MRTDEHLKKAPKGAKPKKADWRRSAIKAALEDAGWSLRRLSVHHGYCNRTINHALFDPYPKAERLIADALGVEPWDIWPSRYDANHQPLSLPGQRKRAGQGRHLGKVARKADDGNVQAKPGDEHAE